MKDEIKKLIQEKQELELRIKKINKVIEAFQEICDHKFVDSGRDSHKSYHKCSICDFEDWY